MRAREEEKICPRRLSGLGQIAEPTGTDGHRPLSHQCWYTSIHPLVSSIKSSNNVFNKTQAVLIILCCRQSHTGIQVPRNLNTRFLLSNGRLCYAASLSFKSRYGGLQTIMVCHTKRSGEPFLLLVSNREQAKCALFLWTPARSSSKFNTGKCFCKCFNFRR